MIYTIDLNKDSLDFIDFLLSNSIKSLTFVQKMNPKVKIARGKLYITNKDEKYILVLWSCGLMHTALNL